jgi:hypothetical protein
MCSCFNSGESYARGERSGTCDVESELESHKLCEVYNDHLMGQPDERFPANPDDFFRIKAEKSKYY